MLYRVVLKRKNLPYISHFNRALFPFWEIMQLFGGEHIKAWSHPGIDRKHTAVGISNVTRVPGMIYSSSSHLDLLTAVNSPKQSALNLKTEMIFVSACSCLCPIYRRHICYVENEYVVGADLSDQQFCCLLTCTFVFFFIAQPRFAHYHFINTMYTALQKFGIILASWSTRGNTTTQMTTVSRISHRIFSNVVW